MYEPFASIQMLPPSTSIEFEVFDIIHFFSNWKWNPTKNLEEFSILMHVNLKTASLKLIFHDKTYFFTMKLIAQFSETSSMFGVFHNWLKMLSCAYVCQLEHWMREVATLLQPNSAKWLIYFVCVCALVSSKHKHTVSGFVDSAWSWPLLSAQRNRNHRIFMRKLN